MQFLSVLYTNVNDAYDVISTILDISVRHSELDECELVIELSDQIYKENLFLNIVGNYEYVGYDVTILDDKESNRYSIKLCWGNYVKPEDEYKKLIDCVHRHKFDYETKVSKLRKVPSQISSFQAYKSSETVIQLVCSYLKNCVLTFMHFVF